jgi:hypothetical protein
LIDLLKEGMMFGIRRGGDFLDEGGDRGPYGEDPIATVAILVSRQVDRRGLFPLLPIRIQN